MGQIDNEDFRVPEERLKKPKKKGKRPPRQERRPLTAEQQRLAAHYLPMARALARPLKRQWPTEHEEFESAACLALVEAAQSYDRSRHVKFATYARHRILGALRDVQRKVVLSGCENDVENAPELLPLVHEVDLFGRVLNTTPDRPVEELLELGDTCEHWLRKLPKKHARACHEFYLHGKNLMQVAETMGCSKSRVFYLLKQSIRMLNDSGRWRDAVAIEDLEKGNDRDLSGQAARSLSAADWPCSS